MEAHCTYSLASLQPYSHCGCRDTLRHEGKVTSACCGNRKWGGSAPDPCVLPFPRCGRKGKLTNHACTNMNSGAATFSALLLEHANRWLSLYHTHCRSSHRHESIRPFQILVVHRTNSDGADRHVRDKPETCCARPPYDARLHRIGNTRYKRHGCGPHWLQCWARPTTCQSAYLYLLEHGTTLQTTPNI